MHILLKFTGAKKLSEKFKNYNLKHKHRTAPKHAYMYSEGQQKWILNSVNCYQKFRCRICQLEEKTTYCRTYCTCNRNTWMCYKCHRNKHLLARCPSRNDDNDKNNETRTEQAKQYNYCNLAVKVKITPFVCSYNLLYNACIRESDLVPQLDKHCYLCVV